MNCIRCGKEVEGRRDMCPRCEKQTLESTVSSCMSMVSESQARMNTFIEEQLWVRAAEAAKTVSHLLCELAKSVARLEQIKRDGR